MSITEEVKTDEHDASQSPARVELKRAYLHMNFAQYDEAIAACARAADQAPDHPLPVALKGSFEMAAGRVRDALGTLRRATKRHPGDALSHIYFAEACLLAGRERQGKRALERAEALAGQQKQDGAPHDVDLAGLIRQVREIWQEIDSAEVPPPLVAEFDEPSDA